MSEKRFKLQHINDLTDQEYMRLKKITDNGELITLGEVVELLNEQQATITKLEQICEKKMQEIENIKYSLKEIAYKYQKEVQFKADTDPNQAVKEVLCEQQATIEQLEKVNGKNFAEKKLLKQDNLILRNENEQLQKKIRVLSAHLLSDECCLTDSQIRKIRKELEE